MKPTQEQVIAWAQEAGLYTKCVVHSAVPFDQLLGRFALLAYEAGRKDENEACEQNLRDFSQTRMVPVLDTWRMGLIAGANAIRARREQ